MKTLDDFKENVDLYSADLSRWPQDLVKPALQMVKENRAAKEYFDEALALDDKLRRYTPKEPALSALESRILDEIRKSPRAPAPAKKDEVSLRSAWIFAPGGGLLAAAVLGFIIGLLPPQQGPEAPPDASYAQIIGGDTDTDTGGLF
jgi:hypothetical protein